MIEYEDLCAALDRYVQRNGGVPTARPVAVAAPAQPIAREPSAPKVPLSMTTSPARNVAPAPAASRFEPPTGEAALPPLGHDGDEGATHVGASPGEPLSDDASNEIDIGDVLSDEEL